mgnify:CR=1 FL=1
MIIVDLSQVMISNLMVQLGNHTNTELEEDLLRHMILNSIRSYNQKFKNEYGEMIIACDAGNNWRREVFPYYKANRRKNREKSELNWAQIFDTLSKVREELKEYFPYRVIQIDTAEADDIIGTLVHKFGNTSEKILVLSGDKDFVQLQRYMNVKQYDPVQKKWRTTNDPDRFIREHIMRGDTGDGVPNFLSADNTFVIGGRQKPISQKKLDAWIHMDPREFVMRTCCVAIFVTSSLLISTTFQKAFVIVSKSNTKLRLARVVPSFSITLLKSVLKISSKVLMSSNMRKLAIAEIIENASKIESVEDRAQYLRNNESEQLKYILELALTPGVKWEVPEGAPPYKPCDYTDIEGRLYQEARTLYIYLLGNKPELTRLKRESLFIGLLESIDKRDAELLILVKDQKLPRTISTKVVNLAFPGLINEQVS